MVKDITAIKELKKKILSYSIIRSNKVNAVIYIAKIDPRKTQNYELFLDVKMKID